MRKKIEVKKQNEKEVKKQNAFNLNKNESGDTMKKIMSAYQKLSAKVKLNYDKESFNDRKKLDYQECLNEVMADILSRQIEIEKPYHFIRRAVAFQMRMRYKQEQKLELTDSNFEQEIYCYPLGEVLMAKEAIEKMLTVEEKKVLQMYGQGYTLEEIGEKVGDNHRTQTNRTLQKAYKKIEALKMATMFDSRFTSYNPKQNKIDKYPEVKEKPSEVINRRFQCLEVKQKAKSIKKYNGEVNTVFTIEDKDILLSNVTNDFTKDYTKNIVVKNHGIKSRVVENICHNKELLQLLLNKSEYQKMIYSEVVISEHRRIVFDKKKYIDPETKYCNIE